MPYKKNTTPRQLKGKGIPQRFMNIFISTYNALMKRYKDVARRFRIAYSAMNKALRKAGYRKGTDGKWHKVRKGEAFASVLEEQINEDILVGIFGQGIITEELSLPEALSKGLNYEGIALMDNIISQQGTGSERFYSPEFNDLCMEYTNAYMALGHTITVYNKHGSAYGGAFAMSSKNPVGKITKPLWRDGENILYKAFISPTSEGKDLIQLYYDGIVKETSVRMNEVTSFTQTIEDVGDDGEKEVTGYLEVMMNAKIIGVDFCDEAGIIGAGVTKPENLAFDFSEESEESDMDWEELTLEELESNAKALLDDYLAKHLDAAKAQIDALTTEVDALKAAAPDDALTEKVTELADLLGVETKKVTGLEFDLAVEKAAQLGLSSVIAEVLHEEAKTVEEIAEKLPGIKERAMATFQASFGVEVKPKGTSKTGDEDVDDDDLTPDKKDDKEFTDAEEEMASYARPAA